MTRTENDTWDLASSVGATATAVATSRALASRGPEPLLDDPWAEALVRAVGSETFIKLLDGQGRDIDDPVMNRRAMNEQVTVRTRYFDEFFLTAADAGIRQAVILASGLDTRAYRLPWPAGTAVFEIDQPDVIAFKTRTLSDLGAQPAAEHHAVAIDLRDDWSTALIAAGLDSGKPTAWIAEGLLVYLPPDAQDRLLDNVGTLSAPGSRLATEHIDMAKMPTDWAQKLTQRSQRAGAKFKLSELFYTGERNSAADYLASRGWSVDIRTTEQAYAANGFVLPNDELAAFTGASGYLTALRTG